MSKKNVKRMKKSDKLEVAKQYPMMRIDWEDHVAGDMGWSNVNNINKKTLICTTVGIQIHEDDKVVTLVQTSAENDDVSNSMTILKNCIVYSKKLGEITYVKKG